MASPEEKLASALCYAVTELDIERVNKCLQQGVDVNLWGNLYDCRRPALAFAAQDWAPPGSPNEAKVFSIMKMLIEHKADPNTPDEDGSTGLHLTRRVNIAKFLLDAKANINAVEGFKGRTALMTYANCNWDDMVALMLDHGANTEIKDRKGKTVLEMKDLRAECKYLISGHRARLGLPEHKVNVIDHGHRILRFKHIGVELTNALPLFSFDILTLVANYMLFPGPVVDLECQPKQLLTISTWPSPGEAPYSREALKDIHAVACPSEDAIVIADKNSMWMFGWNSNIPGHIDIGIVSGIAVDGNEMFICKPNRVDVCDAHGSVKHQLNYGPAVITKELKSIAVRGNRVYLVDAGKFETLFVLTRKGNLVKRIKGTKEHGRFVGLRAVAVNPGPGGGFCIVEGENRACFFDEHGKHLRCLEVISKLEHIAFDQFGNLIVVGEKACIYDTESMKLMTEFLVPGEPTKWFWTRHNISTVFVDKDNRVLVGVHKLYHDEYDGHSHHERLVQVFAFE